MADLSSSRQTNRAYWASGMLLALLPVASFLLQYAMSVARGTEAALFRHFTVAYIDWIFVPFNLLVVRIIDWRQGARISLVAIASLIFNVAGHAVWQYHGTDGGHMITSGQVVLPAGWVHLVFSIIEGTLILAFALVRKPSQTFPTVATTLAFAYFLSAGVSGYVMNHGFQSTDVIMASGGVLLVVVYPYLAQVLHFGRQGK